LNDNEYIPAEVAVSKFTLDEGVVDVFHTLINPGKLPLGFPGAAKDHSDKVHSIPPPPYAKGEDDYTKILEAIVELFISGTKLPIFFTSDYDVAMAQSIIDRFRLEANVEMDFPVYSITELFFTLKKATAEIGNRVQTFPNIYVARSEFEKEVFDYHEGMGCDFHSNEASGKFRNCSKTKVVGWCYTFADYCCPDLDIKLVPGCHLPKCADTSVAVPMPELMEFSETKSYVSANTRFGDTQSEASSYTMPYSGASGHTSTYRPGPPQQQQKAWKSPSSGPPPGYPAAKKHDPQNSSNRSEMNANNPFLPDITKNREKLNQTYGGGSVDDFPSLNESNRLSRSHMANETRSHRDRPQAKGAGRGMPFNNNTVWGGRQ
jgi:piRNA pathway germ-plasm component